MSKSLRIILLIFLTLTPIIFYKSFHRRERKTEIVSHLPSVINTVIDKEANLYRPKIALIFDDLGESLSDLKEIHSLNIPVTVSVIPGLKFSKNIGHIGLRCGFSVFIHLPLSPLDRKKYRTDKYRFIGSSLSKREINSLLRYYLNSIRIAIGVNNHMGSEMTEDAEFMRFILKAIKRKGLIFIDSRTSLKSVAYKEAKQEDLVCGYNEGFLDSVDNVEAIEEKLQKLIDRAKEKGKIIIIAHPKKNTFDILRRKLPTIRKEVEFITIKDYFEL
ncbi:MAG: divergent polysaccharide deacetylase family protein [Candidatus Omnitrophica bacterium]|nr:divergent polysaccharide deacetylase family protein [Candidatus Omnitrophota bacterium]